MAMELYGFIRYSLLFIRTKKNIYVWKKIKIYLFQTYGQNPFVFFKIKKNTKKIQKNTKKYKKQRYKIEKIIKKNRKKKKRKKFKNIQKINKHQ